MIETAEAKQMSQAASSPLLPELDSGTEDNATYPAKDFQRVLGRIAFDNEFANAGAKAYQLTRGNDVDVGAESRSPLARTLLYHLRGLDADAAEGQLDRVRDAVLNEAARNRLFTRPVDVAIDVHDRCTTATAIHRTSPELIPTEEQIPPTSSPPSVSSIQASGSRLDGSR